MITIFFVGLAVAVIVMEFIISPKLSYHLSYRYTYDTELAEPDEKIVFTGRLINSFSLPKRGVYRGGRYFIETGDFLGFRSYVRSEKLSSKITVMPRKCEDEQVIRALGGYIGDISVRRFIIKDPILNICFREYTGHEPMKMISWPQSVRAGKLMVKNNDYTVDMNVAIVLNMYTGSNAEKEKCLEIVRTVCEQIEANRVPYSFFCNGDIREKKEPQKSRSYQQRSCS